MKKKITLRQGSVLMLVILLVLGVLFYAVAHEQLTLKLHVDSAVAPEANVGELLAGDIAEQTIVPEGDALSALSIFFQTYGRTNTCHIEVRILDGETLLAAQTVDASTLADNAYADVSFALTDVAGKKLTVQLESPDAVSDNAVTVGYGSSASVGHSSVELVIDDPAVWNGTVLDGRLSIGVTSIEHLGFGTYYWEFLAAFLLVVGAYLLRLQWCQKKGKSCLGLRFLDALRRYRFLIHQLVDRDFKTKYKRSVLGVFWSFLNPLLTMLVQYVVFSTLFRSDIPNYPVYLLVGIVCYSYFSEAIGQCMLSIVGNASLITKVYVPKYIYPLSKALSSCINLLLSMIPLVGVMFLTGLYPRPSFILLPFGLVCLFMLCLGMGMILSTLMVFFRDTQFLWGVVSMLWMYATPIFYPESIIPAKWMLLYKMNPLYHVIRFCRCVLIDGVSPEPKAYALCLIACLIPLLLGLSVFKRQQNKFILHI